MNITTKFKMDLARRGVTPRLDAVQGDENTRAVQITLYANGTAWEPPEGTTAAVAFKKPDGTRGLYDHLPDGDEATTLNGNVVTATLAPQVLTSPGAVQAAIVLYDTDLDTLSTFQFNVIVEANPAAGEQVSNSYYYVQNLEQINEAYAELLARADAFDESVAELEDIRVGYDGATYATAGEAVRAVDARVDKASNSIAELEKIVNGFSDSGVESNFTIEMEQGGMSADGTDIGSATRIRTVGYLDLSEVVSLTLTAKPDYQIRLFMYDDTKTVTNPYAYIRMNQAETLTTADCAYLRFYVEQDDDGTQPGVPVATEPYTTYFTAEYETVSSEPDTSNSLVGDVDALKKTVTSHSTQIEELSKENETTLEALSDIQDVLYGIPDPVDRFDSSAVMDGANLEYNKNLNGGIGSYAPSILSGYQSVSEGKTYFIKCDSSIVSTGAIAFFDADKTPICAVATNGVSQYGGGAYFWIAIDGFATVGGDGYTREVAIQHGSGIAYMNWYLSNAANTGDYYGTHTVDDLTAIVAGVELYEGSLPGVKSTSLIEQMEELYEQVYGDDDKSIDTAVVLTVAGDKIQVRSAWDENNDMCIRAGLHTSANKAFCFDSYMVTVPKSTDYENISSIGSYFKNVHDDITPLEFNHSYMGGGHGYYCGKKITFDAAHGFIESNIGEMWTESSANGYQLILLKVLSTTEALFACPYYEQDVSRPFSNITPVSPMVKGSSSKAFTAVSTVQVDPAANHVSVAVNVDGVAVESDGVYGGNYVDVIETYDILYIPAMVEYLKSNIGSNTNDSLCNDEITEKYCSVCNVYRFTERGAMTLYQSIDFDKSVYFGFAGMVQSQGIGSYYCIPGTSHKFLSEQGSAEVRLKPDTWENADYPPDRFYQYADASSSKGICLGYNTEIGDGRPELRKTTTDAGFIYTTKKVYPHLLKVDDTVEAGYALQAVSYRVPLRSYDEDVPSVGWYYVGDDIYLLLDVQKSVNKYITLPDKMIGRKLTPVKEFGNISVFPGFVGSNGIKVKVSDYGSGVYKLTRN